MLRLALPKGSLERATLQLFEDADLALSRSSERDYRATIADPRIWGVYGTQSDDAVEDLAYHFTHAQAASVEKAIGYSLRAAGKSMGLFAHEEAVRFYRNTLDLLRELKDEAREAVQDTLTATSGLTDVVSALREGGRHVEVLRYLMGPPLSQDQFRLVCPEWSKTSEKQDRPLTEIRDLPPLGRRSRQRPDVRRRPIGERHGEQLAVWRERRVDDLPLGSTARWNPGEHARGSILGRRRVNLEARAAISERPIDHEVQRLAVESNHVSDRARPNADRRSAGWRGCRSTSTANVTRSTYASGSSCTSTSSMRSAEPSIRPPAT